MAATRSSTQPAPDDHPRGGHAPGGHRPAALARLVAPLIADALALEARIARCAPADGAGRGDPAPPPLAVFADQLRASAVLMGECAGVAPPGRAPRADAPTNAPTDAPPDPPADAVRHLLDDEDRIARHLRRAIATCDRRGDDWTADRLEEVLDEVVWQRRRLADLLPGAVR
jgi:hypothetical protein